MLLLPESLNKKILDFIKPIGLEILNWKVYHERFVYGRVSTAKILNRLCWASQGTVDKKKTAKVLIRNENLKIADRYELACIYCLKNDIPELWNRIPENCRKSFYIEEDPMKVLRQDLVILWKYDIKGEVDKLDYRIERSWEPRCSSYQFAFEYAAYSGNKTATEYFLQKLTSKEREESLVRSAGSVASKRYYCARNLIMDHEDFAEILRFLFSQMNEEQQIEVLKSHPYGALYFLDWPFQSLFMETANRMWDFLSGEECYYFLIEMVDKVIEGHRDYDYQNFFGEFWKQSLNVHKRYAIDKCAYGSLLPKLFEVKDAKNISLILKDATFAEKETHILYREGKDICERLIYSHELNFFIQECISSKNILIKFKEEFKKRVSRRLEELEEEKYMWSKFFKLLDDLIHRDDKNTTMEEGECSSAKRLRSARIMKVTRSMKKSKW